MVVKHDDEYIPPSERAKRTKGYDYRRSKVRIGFWKLMGYVFMATAGAFILGFSLAVLLV